jgi:hypothetical protein
MSMSTKRHHRSLQSIFAFVLMCTVRLWICFYFTTLALFNGLLMYAAFCDDPVLVISGHRDSLRVWLFTSWSKYELGSLLVMANRQVILRNNCVNCNISIIRLHRRPVFDLETRVISVICEWTSPIIVSYH